VIAARGSFLVAETNSKEASRNAHARPGLHFFLAFLLVCVGTSFGNAQTAAPQITPEAPVQLVYPPKPAGETGPPATITLADALQRAQKNNAEFLSALSDQRVAQEDRLQARNARLPQFGFRSEYLGVQGNGKTPNGRFVTQDGVHVYREWATLHQDLTANILMGTDYKRSQAAEAIAAAKAEIARRGLTVTVTKSFYALVVAQRKYATAQEALAQAQRFLQLAEDTERAGQAAHSDVIKAQMEGGIGFGIGAVLYGAITLKAGKVEQSNFYDYQVLRIEDMPAVEVHIVPSTEAPTGVGEPGVPPVGPALSNAVFAASGKRLRTLPLAVGGTG